MIASTLRVALLAIALWAVAGGTAIAVQCGGDVTGATEAPSTEPPADEIEVAGVPSRLWPFYKKYRTLPHYRALVCAGGGIGEPVGCSWVCNANDPRAAIKKAMANCKKMMQRDYPISHPPCKLRFIGDIDVFGMSRSKLDQAIEQYRKDVEATKRGIIAGAAIAKNAKSYYRAGDYDRAIKQYTEAIRLDPANTKYHRNRGMAYRKKGDHDRAIQDYTEAIRLDPSYTFAYRSRGLAHADKGDYDRAIADYTEAIRLDPTYARAYNSRGNAYDEKGDYDRAIQDYSEAIRLDPDYASAYNNRCWQYGLMRRPHEALRDCNESLRLRPDNPATLDSRALAYWLLDEHDKARRDLERAREIDSERPLWRDRFREFEEMF